MIWGISGVFLGGGGGRGVELKAPQVEPVLQRWPSNFCLKIKSVYASQAEHPEVQESAITDHF